MLIKYANKLINKYKNRKQYKAYREHLLANFERYSDVLMNNFNIDITKEEPIRLTNQMLHAMSVNLDASMNLMSIPNIKSKDGQVPSEFVRNNSFTNMGYGTPSGVGGLQNTYANIGNTMGIMGSDSLNVPYYIYMTYWTTFYQTNSIAKRLVDVVTESMVSHWITIEANNEAKDYEMVIQKTESFIKKKRIKGMVTRAVRQMFMHGGCAFYIDTYDADLKEPLNRKTLKSTFRRFAFVDQGLLVPIAFQGTFDFASDNFNQPEFWQIIFPNGNKSLQIHHTRFIFWIPEELPFYAKINQQWWGSSIYVAVNDDIMNAERAFKSTGQVVQQGSVKFLKTDMRNRTRVPGAAAPGMDNKNILFQKAITQNGNAILLDKEDEIEKLEIGNLKGQTETNISLINKVCSTMGIPLTRFWGNPIAGFSSGDAEILQWEQTIKFNQESYQERPMTELIEVISWVLFGDEDTIGFTFNPVREQSETQEADVALKNAQRRAIDFQNGVPLNVMLKQLAREGIYADLKIADCDKYAKEFEDKQMEIEKANLAGMESKDVKDGKAANGKPTSKVKANQPENVAHKTVHK